MTGPLVITQWARLTHTTGERVRFEGFASVVEGFASPVLARDKGSLPGWSPTLFEGDRRKKAGAETFCAVVVEHDDGVATVERAAEVFGCFRGLIHTSHSHTVEAPRFRVVIALREPRPAADYPRAWAHLASIAAAAGVPLDPSCKDVSRLWYWPGAPAERRELYQLVELGGEPLDVEALPIEAEGLFAPRARGRVAPGGVAAAAADGSAPPRPVSLAREKARRAARQGAPVLALANVVLPPEWEAFADEVGASIRDHGAGGYHRCFLWLVAALIDRHCPVAYVAAVIARAAAVDVGWESKQPDRLGGVRTTLDRIAGGEKVAGYPALRDAYPEVADAFDRALEALDGTKRAPVALRVRTQLDEPAPAPVPTLAADETMARELRDARGCLVLRLPPGAGKTRGVVEFVNGKPALLPTPSGRKRSGETDAYAGATTKLVVSFALQVPGAKRLFSPLAHTDENGAPTCRFIDAGRALAAGGQSVWLEFCDGRGKNPCPHRANCPAAECFEGDDKAYVVAGPIKMMGALSGAAGPCGYLFVDELTEALTVEHFALDDFETAARYLNAFVPEYAAAMRPALLALTAYVGSLGPVVEDARSDAPLVLLPDMIRACAPAVPAGVLEAAGIDPSAGVDAVGDLIIEAVVNARTNDEGDPSRDPPPLKWLESRRAMLQPARALELGQASRMLHVLRKGLMGPKHGPRYYAGRITLHRGERTVNLIGEDEDFARAVMHEGRLVFLDANADLLLPALRARRRDLTYVDINVRDGAPIRRAIIATNSATYSKTVPHGVPDWAAILPLLRAALAWLAEDPRTKRAGLFVPKEIEAGIAYALRPDAPATLELVKAARSPRRTLEAAAKLLRPLLATWPGELALGHYRALRGLNDWQDCDATITLVDPRPHLGVEFEKALYLGVDPAERCNAIARAELQQAHGRLRTIHRTREGRQLHIGSLAPAGWNGPEGRRVEVRVLPVGRPRGVAAMAPSELRRIREDVAETSSRQFAKLLGISSSHAARYESGETPIPPEVAARARALDPECPANPCTEESSDRGLRDTPGYRGLRSTTATGVCGTPRADEPDDAERTELAAWLAGDETSRGAA